MRVVSDGEFDVFVGGYVYDWVEVDGEVFCEVEELTRGVLFFFRVGVGVVWVVVYWVIGGRVWVCGVV